MNVNVNDVVKLRNGSYGCVVSYANQPKYIIFAKYISKVSVYDDNLKHKKNDQYDIVKVFKPIDFDKLDTLFRPSMSDDKLELVSEINAK